MHIQARTLTSMSPADLGTVLEKLAQPANGSEPINIEGVAGDGLELGGQFVFSFDHDREADVVAAIGDYKGFEIVRGNLDLIQQPASAVGSDDELHVRVLGGNRQGELRRAIQDAASPQSRQPPRDQERRDRAGDGQRPVLRPDHVPGGQAPLIPRSPASDRGT